ncbi:MAG: hypothetical protein ABIK44_06825 [candidate division WOR-3 bacterium]
MKPILLAISLVLCCVGLVPGCRGRKVSVTGKVSITPVRQQSDTSDLAGLPHKLRYPGAEVCDAGSSENQALKSGHYIIRTSDTLGTVEAYYLRAMSELGIDIGCTGSDDMVTIDGCSEDGGNGTLLTLVRQETGTLIIIVNWAKR